MVEELFLFQNISYILAFTCLLASVALEGSPAEGAVRGGGEGSHRHRPALRKPAALLQRTALVICGARFLVAYPTIFTDAVGGGDMFSFAGVLELFRTKGDAWVVGIWTELCTLFVICGYWITCDNRGSARPMGRWTIALCLGVTALVAGVGFVLYVALRAMADARCSPPLASEQDSKESDAAAALDLDRRSAVQCAR